MTFRSRKVEDNNGCYMDLSLVLSRASHVLQLNVSQGRHGWYTVCDECRESGCDFLRFYPNIKPKKYHSSSGPWGRRFWGEFSVSLVSRCLSVFCLVCAGRCWENEWVKKYILNDLIILFLGLVIIRGFAEKVFGRKKWAVVLFLVSHHQDGSSQPACLSFAELTATEAVRF